MNKLFLISLLLLSPIIHAKNQIVTTTDTSVRECTEVEFQKSANSFANSYLLKDIMEVGSELLLEKDGRFKWYLVVGSLDQYAEGHWWQNGTCIGLKADEKYQPDLEIFPSYLRINQKNLDVVWDAGTQGTYKPAKTPTE